MNKFAVMGCVIVLVAWVTAINIVGVHDEPSFTPDAAKAKAIQDHIASYWCFNHTFMASIDALGKGDIDLREAHERVGASARAYHPRFFVHLTQSDPGTTDDERLAHNLVGHIRAIEEVSPAAYRERVKALEIELQEFLLELQARD